MELADHLKTYIEQLNEQEKRRERVIPAPGQEKKIHTAWEALQYAARELKDELNTYKFAKDRAETGVTAIPIITYHSLDTSTGFHGGSGALVFFIDDAEHISLGCKETIRNSGRIEQIEKKFMEEKDFTGYLCTEARSPGENYQIQHKAATVARTLLPMVDYLQTPKEIIKEIQAHYNR